MSHDESLKYSVCLKTEEILQRGSQHSPLYSLREGAGITWLKFTLLPLLCKFVTRTHLHFPEIQIFKVQTKETQAKPLLQLKNRLNENIKIT